MYLYAQPFRRRLRFLGTSAIGVGETVTGSIPGFTAAEEKALRLTDAIENTSWYVKNKTLSFRGLMGDVDKQGLSFGLLQWNIGTGSLQPLLLAFEREQPQRFNEIFGPHQAEMRQVLRQSKDQQLQWARSINTDNKKRLREPWATYFRRLGDDAVFQQIQLRYVSPRMEAAVKYARQFGLRSERGLALMFDIVTQQGHYWLTCKKPKCKKRATLIEQGRAAARQRLGRELNEQELLEVIANAIAAVALPRWRDKVRARKMTIVAGRGRIHGHDFDLARDFNLTDRPWDSGSRAAMPVTPSAPDVGPKTTNGGPFSKLWNIPKTVMDLPGRGAEFLALQHAISSGLRDRNRLTSLLFFARHKELGGKPLRRDQPRFKELSQEWLDIRDRIVSPALDKAVSIPTTVPSQPSGNCAIDKYQYDFAKSCTKGEQPGTIALRDFLYAQFGRRRAGIHNCRPIRGSTKPSLHGEGRALDFYLNARNPAQRDLGDSIVRRLLATDNAGNLHALARRLGVQEIIWNGKIWSSRRWREGLRRFTGKSPHIDHIHIGQNWMGARKQTSFWRGCVQN